MALNDYDVFISQSPRGGRLCENQRFGFGKKAIMALKLQVLIFLKPNSIISI
jgi:hypothetical protein